MSVYESVSEGMMTFSLATSGVDLGDESACLRHLHDSGYRALHTIPDSRWSQIIDEARALRAWHQSERPSLSEVAAAVLVMAAVWVGLIAQGPVS